MGYGSKKGKLTKLENPSSPSIISINTLLTQDKKKIDECSTYGS